MAWPAGGPGTAVAGNVATASFVNTNYRDALDALVGGYSEIASLATGDVLYASSASQIGRVAADSGKFLKSGASAPSWAQMAFSELSGSIADGQVPESAVTQHVTSASLLGLSGRLDGGETRYVGLGGTGGLTESLAISRLPFACTIDLMYVDGENPGGSETVTFTVRKNSSDQSLSVVLNGGETQDEDTSNSVAYAAGDDFALKIVASAGVGIGHDSQIVLRVTPT